MSNEAALRALTNKDIKQYVRRLLKDGWTVADRGKGVLTLTSPDGAVSIPLHTTNNHSSALRSLRKTVERKTKGAKGDA